MDIENIKQEKYALSTEDLKKFCNLNNLPYSVIDITELETTDLAQTFVHTGDKKNDINKGNINHWLYLYGNEIFDSYGDPSAFVYPSNITPFPNQRLQEFGTNVCGPYCLAFNFFLTNKLEFTGTSSSKHIASEYEDYFDLTNNKKQNDENIKTWYNTRNDRATVQKETM